MPSGPVIRGPNAANITGIVGLANGGTGSATLTGITGSGNIVASASPTFTGTAIFASITASGNIFVSGSNNFIVGAVGTNSSNAGFVINAAGGGLVARYGTVTVAGWGLPAIYGYGDSVAQTNVVASVATYTVGAADGTFEVGAEILVTAFTSGTIAINVTFTDEGNTSHTYPFFIDNGNAQVAVANGTGAWQARTSTIRCKAGTAITISTTGTFVATYNARGVIKQVG